MKRIIISLMIFSLCLSGCTGSAQSEKKKIADNAVKKVNIKVLKEENKTVKRDLLCVMMAYPQYITGVEEGDDGCIYIIMKSGKKIIYDDNKKKNHQQKIENSDVQDMLEQVYPADNSFELMDENFDPGRARVYSLLKEAYGNSESAVRSNLTGVRTSGGSFTFNKNNSAAQSLKQAFDELMPMAKKDRKIMAALLPSSGTFNYRTISGTNLLSPHSFGIAIDLARDKRDYWQWASRKEGQERLKSYPKEIVTVFEKHNFIWGGKWGHFDILHFEYRPEIIYKSKYFKNTADDRNPWYEGAPCDDLEVKKYIDIIDTGLSR